jgi:hypothetical protein
MQRSPSHHIGLFSCKGTDSAIVIQEVHATAAGG